MQANTRENPYQGSPPKPQPPHSELDSPRPCEQYPRRGYDPGSPPEAEQVQVDFWTTSNIFEPLGQRFWDEPELA